MRGLMSGLCTEETRDRLRSSGASGDFEANQAAMVVGLRWKNSQWRGAL
jgi:hypothetical protein